MELEQERQEKKTTYYRKLHAICKKYSSYKESKRSKKAIHEVKEEYAKIENLVQDNEEEKE